MLASVLALGLLATSCTAAIRPHAPVPAKKLHNRKLVKPRAVAPPKTKAGYACEGCVEFMDDAINTLLNTLLGVIPTSCEDLCAAAFPSSPVEQEICSGLCSVAGLYEFINILENTDISPVWACLELDACTSTTCTSNCANLTRLTSQPLSQAPPNAFQWNYIVTFANGVGTSTTFAGINEVRGGNSSWGCDSGVIWYDAPTAGSPYSVSLTSTLEQDPGQGFPPICPSPGQYQLAAEVCEGQCGDTFSNSGPVLGSAISSTLLTVQPSQDGCQPV